MILIFLIFRNKETLAPSNMVFLNYLLYFIFPCILFYVFKLYGWEYVLPWGKINDWSTLSIEAVLSYFYVFTLFFSCTRFLENGKGSTKKADFFRGYKIRPVEFFMILALVFIGDICFMQVTGGMDAWTSDYSNTYMQNKKGYGLLNFLLIQSANFIAFLLGVYLYLNKKVSIALVVFVILVLVFSAFFQGIKSRIFYFAIFISIPWLCLMRITILRGIVIFSGFVLAFSFAMYFRSNGFYDTPAELLEYFLSYFNTIFLHDMIIIDMPLDFFVTIDYPINKWMTFFGVNSESYLHDISRWLTSVYFPEQWMDGAATQQWPVETELYLNYGYYVFWIIPIFIYSLFICTLYLMRYRLGPVFIFIYVSELLMFVTMFRGSMTPWIIPFNFLVYVVFFFAGKILCTRVVIKHGS